MGIGGGGDSRVWGAGAGGCGNVLLGMCGTGAEGVEGVWNSDEDMGTLTPPRPGGSGADVSVTPAGDGGRNGL